MGRPKVIIHLKQDRVCIQDQTWTVTKTTNTIDPRIGDIFTPRMVNAEIRRGHTVHITT